MIENCGKTGSNSLGSTLFICWLTLSGSLLAFQCFALYLLNKSVKSRIWRSKGYYSLGSCVKEDDLFREMFHFS